MDSEGGRFQSWIGYGLLLQGCDNVMGPKILLQILKLGSVQFCWHINLWGREPLPLSIWVFSSIQWLSLVWLFVTPWTAAHQASCPSSTPRVYPNSCPLSWWCHPTIFSPKPRKNISIVKLKLVRLRKVNLSNIKWRRHDKLQDKNSSLLLYSFFSPLLSIKQQNYQPVEMYSNSKNSCFLIRSHCFL